MANPLPLYNLPTGSVGRLVLAILVKEWKGVRECRWNSERPIVFGAVILIKGDGIIRAWDIKHMIKRMLDLWEDQKYVALARDTVEEALRGIGGGNRRTKSDEHRGKTYNSMVLPGRI